MIWTGIINQTIIWPFKIDEGVKLNSDNNWDLIKKTFFCMIQIPALQFQSEVCIYAQQHSFSCI